MLIISDIDNRYLSTKWLKKKIYHENSNQKYYGFQYQKKKKKSFSLLKDADEIKYIIFKRKRNIIFTDVIYVVYAVLIQAQQHTPVDDITNAIQNSKIMDPPPLRLTHKLING